MAWNLIGWFGAIAIGAAGTAVTFLYPNYRDFGVLLLAVAAVAALLTLFGLLHKSWELLTVVSKRIGAAKTMLFVGILGTWIFLTLALGASAWLVTRPPASAVLAAPITGDGPLKWYGNLEMEGGPPSGRNVFALTFFGSNGSEKEVLLKNASIVSAQNGRKLALDVIAQDDKGQPSVIPVDQINLVPPGAPIRLIAKFGDSDPNAPGKILGLDAKTFLETWSKFYFIVEDDTKTYRIPINEGNLMAFFPGMVGPHITKK